MKHWTEQFFDLRYLQMFMQRSPERLQHDVQALVRLGALTPGQTVGDFCCGIGDMLAQLRHWGVDGCGVELSADYVQYANTHWPHVPVMLADALTFQFGRQFDLTYNWFSSFGYLGEEGDVQLLRNMVQHTRPGGRVVLEMLHAQHVLDSFKPVISYPVRWNGKAWTVHRHSVLDSQRLTIQQRWTFVEGSGKDDDRALAAEDGCDSYLQMYTTQQLQHMLDRAGLRDVHFWQSPSVHDGVALRPLQADSPRLCVVASKPE